jgi:hypothetical protein
MGRMLLSPVLLYCTVLQINCLVRIQTPWYHQVDGLVVVASQDSIITLADEGKCEKDQNSNSQGGWGRGHCFWGQAFIRTPQKIWTRQEDG